MKKSQMVMAGVVGAAVLLGVSLYGYANSLRADGIQMEQGLVAQYKSEQAQLSGFLVKVKEILQVANIKTDKLDTVLTNAVRGRYGNDGFGSGSPGLAAIQEAYPTIDLSQYDKVQTAIEAGRDEQQNLQSKRADMVRVYNVWRMSGLIRSLLIGNYFPSSALRMQIGSQTYERGEALRKLEETITSAEGDTTFQSGTMKPMDLK